MTRCKWIFFKGYNIPIGDSRDVKSTHVCNTSMGKECSRYHIEGNFGRGNFGEFGDSLQIRQSLTRQLLVAPEISIFIATD